MGQTEGYRIVRFVGDPAEDTYEACPVCEGRGCLGIYSVCKGEDYLVARELNSQGGNMVTSEEINAAITSIEADLEDAGLEYGPDGTLVKVHTPYACGFTEKEEDISKYIG